MIKKILAFFKQEAVLCIALLLAILAIVFIKPEATEIIAAIDFRVLSLLFCLMAVIKAFQSIGVLDAIANSLLSKCSNIRIIYIVLCALVFFSSMLVTNDVALLTFVPLTLIICRKAKLNAVCLIVLETIAANLGSCFTPMGNPQNLFLYSYYTMDTKSFFKATSIIAIPSAILILISILINTKKNNNNSSISFSTQKTNIHFSIKMLIYIILLLTILCSVFRVLDYKISLIITIITIAICNYKLFTVIDYSLLFTFVGFFIFTGTISKVEEVSTFLKSILDSQFSTYIVGILTSQVISNVPAALLLSGFTPNAQSLLLAVNVGGLGTIIASLASVISYKLYKADLMQNEKEHTKNSYMKTFTLYNILFLIIIGILVWLLKGLI